MEKSVEKFLRNLTIDECIRDASHTLALRPYVPFAGSLITLRRLVLQYWRDVYDLMPWLVMFSVLFKLFANWLFS